MIFAAAADFEGWGALLVGVAAVLTATLTAFGILNRRDVKATRGDVAGINAAVNNATEDEEDKRHLRDITKDNSVALDHLTEAVDEALRRLTAIESRSAGTEGRIANIETKLGARQSNARQSNPRRDERPPRL